MCVCLNVLTILHGWGEGNMTAQSLLHALPAVMCALRFLHRNESKQNFSAGFLGIVLVFHLYARVCAYTLCVLSRLRGERMGERGWH